MDDVAASPRSIRFSLLGFLSGGLTGAGGLVLAQQAGRLELSPAQLIPVVGMALLFGLVVPSAAQVLANGRASRMAVGAGSTIGLVVIMAGLMAPSAAGAQSACSLTINSQVVAQGSVVTIADNQDMTASFDGTGVTAGSVAVMFGPIQVYSDSFTLDSPETGQVTRVLKPADFGSIAIGRYAIDAKVETTSGVCPYAFSIVIDGDPLSTPIGKAAAGATVIGGLGSALTVIRAALTVLRAGTVV